MRNEPLVAFDRRRRFVIGLPALLSACATPGLPPAPASAPARPAAPPSAAAPTPVPAPAPASTAPAAPPPALPAAPPRTGAVAMPVPGPSAMPVVPPGQPAPRPWSDLPVFSIVRLDVRDPRAFGDYLTGHLPTVVAGGGRFLAAGALPQPVEGDWPLRRMVIHQWPSSNAFFAWYESSAYVPWRQIRQRAAETDLVLVQGIAASAPSETQPPAFAIFDAAVRDPAVFERYLQGHSPALRAAGGEVLAAAGRHQVVEGTWFPRSVTLQRWPSTAAFRAWYESAAYRPWRDLRWSIAQADVVLLEGLGEAQKRERGMP